MANTSHTQKRTIQCIFSAMAMPKSPINHARYHKVIRVSFYHYSYIVYILDDDFAGWLATVPNQLFYTCENCVNILVGFPLFSPSSGGCFIDKTNEIVMFSVRSITHPQLAHMATNNIDWKFYHTLRETAREREKSYNEIVYSEMECVCVCKHISFPIKIH